MNASKPSISTDWFRVDAYENTHADYDELPELDDTFFDRAERDMGIGDRPIPFTTNPEDTARIARLRDAIVEIWGRSAYDVRGLKRGPDGRLLLLLEPTEAADD